VYIDDVVTSCHRGRRLVRRPAARLHGEMLSSGDLCRHPRVNFGVDPADSFYAYRNRSGKRSLGHQVVKGGSAQAGHFLY